MAVVVSLSAHDTLRATATFAVDGVNTDPAVVTFHVENPAGTKTTYTYLTDSEVTKVATGQFRLTLPFAGVAGDWFVEARGTGAAAGAVEGQVRVKESRF